jgi:superfamily II DNA helicase RecQ
MNLQRDANVVASCGYGKSLIYQFPAVYLNGIAIVISPLISLMQDQTLNLIQKNIRAQYWSYEQKDRSIINKIDQFNIFYITPGKKTVFKKFC